MATFTGQVASFAALKVAIETTLTARGWTLANGILSKGAAFVQLTATATELRLQAGTGQAGDAADDHHREDQETAAQQPDCDVTTRSIVHMLCSYNHSGTAKFKPKPEISRTSA